MTTTTAARLIRDARRSVGWTQRQLSDGSGVAVSVLSAYENGRRDPGVEALTRILGAMLAQGTVDVERVRSRLVALVGADDAQPARLTEAVRSASVQDPSTFTSLLQPRRPGSSDTP